MVVSFKIDHCLGISLALGASPWRMFSMKFSRDLANLFLGSVQAYPEQGSKTHLGFPSCCLDQYVCEQGNAFGSLKESSRNSFYCSGTVRGDMVKIIPMKKGKVKVWKDSFHNYCIVIIVCYVIPNLVRRKWKHFVQTRNILTILLGNYLNIDLWPWPCSTSRSSLWSTFDPNMTSIICVSIGDPKDKL